MAPVRIFQPGLLSLLLVLTLQACASPPRALVSPSPFTSPEVEALAEELRRDFAVTIHPSAHWTEGDLQGVRLGLEALPQVFLPDEDRPLHLVRSPRFCLLGMGRYTDACPTFSDDDRLYIYEALVLDDEPRYEVRNLSQEDQLRILRARAVAHGLLARADDIHDLSSTPTWHQVSGWDRAGRHARNRHTEGFVRTLGQRSDRLDLITSAETYLLRPEDLPNTSALLDRDATFSCQEFTRQQVLSELFDELNSDWRRGTFREAPEDSTACPAFSTWAAFDRLQGLYLLFTPESTGRPEQLFGHLQLQIVHGSREGGQAERSTYAFSASAYADDAVDFVSYVVEGITGRYLARLERRDPVEGSRRYRLNLSEPETLLLLERIWEVEERFAYAYYFTTRNSASLLLELLDPVLDRRPLPRRLVSTPTEVLEILHRRDVLAPPEGDALRPSHTRRLRVGATALPTFRLELAALDDPLGRSHLFGHSPTIEARIFALRAELPLLLHDSQARRHFDIQFTPLRYIALSSTLGWGFDTQIQIRNHALPVTGRAFGAPFLSLLRNQSGTRRLALGVGPALTSEITTEAQHVTGGGQAMLLAHLPLSRNGAYAMHVEARYLQAWQLPSLEEHRQLELRAELDLFVPLGRHAVLLSPFLEWRSQRYDGLQEPVLDTRLSLGVMLEPLLRLRNTTDP